jgi:malonate decarboxylase gamma subunit
MNWRDLCHALFGEAHDVAEDDQMLRGSAQFDGVRLDVLGTTGHAAIGYAMALRQARAVLDTVTTHPGRTLLLLIDTQGQRLRLVDELLGIHRAMAHLGQAIDFARRRGHRVLGVVYDQALSGGFITTGLLADACHALPDAEIRVMRLPAMARITKLPQALLESLSVANPVFAPGVDNYLAMGGLASLWEGDLAEALRRSLAELPTEDRRARDGAERGGRRLAAATVQRILDAA